MGPIISNDRNIYINIKEPLLGSTYFFLFCCCCCCCCCCCGSNRNTKLAYKLIWSLLYILIFPLKFSYVWEGQHSGCKYALATENKQGDHLVFGSHTNEFVNYLGLEIDHTSK